MHSSNARTVLVIEGMRSNDCREIVSEALESVDGVTEVYVNLYRICATVIHEPRCKAVDLIAVVESLGYSAVIEAAVFDPASRPHVSH